ncbi:MAG TPA: CPBP family intramembrane glutamic endopeptidase [Mycobacteriales bacterium]|jgi:membrane protease YdiL (CAAX protease family)|nr:CPBP family intramembrane glutamic endopeptidase [Mycobacteriales bacterium]
MVTTEYRTTATRTPVQIPQYTAATVVGIWALAALPMAAMAWLVTPLVEDRFDGPTALIRALVVSLTAGLVWQFVVVLAIVRREQGSLQWSVLREALWLRAPEHPRSGRRGGRVWLIMVPLVLAVAAKEMLPSFPSPDSRDLGLFLDSDAGQGFLSGNWGWFAVIVTMFVFNTVLGEELLFRGLLLPRMQGAFGRWDWAANAVLFGLYHLHVPWSMHKNVLSGFLYAYPTRRYRSALVGIAVHSVQSVIFTILLLALVLK